MKKILISASTGFLIGVVSVYYFTSKPDKDLKKITVHQVSGEEINHNSFNYKGSTISFKTVSKGLGIIKTEIPKDNIPEVRSWNHRVHGLGLNISMIYNNRLIRLIGPAYEYRWKNITLNSSVLFGSSESGYAVQVIGGVKYWFEL